MGRHNLQTTSALPLVLDREREVRRAFLRRRPAVFLDYDGTLTPIVDDYTKARLSEPMRAAIAALSARCPVAIVSGRDVEPLRQLVRLDTVYYAGSHGFEVVGPAGWDDRLEKGAELLPALDLAEGTLRDRLAGVAGHAVERKRFSIAVHYRHVAPADVPVIEAIVDAVASERPGLQKAHGKKVFEVRPTLAWDKGRATIWLLERLGLRRGAILPVYVGDDITDEDAFRALEGDGLTVVVRDAEDRTTAARYAAADVGEVRRFLDLLTAIASEANDDSGASKAR